VSIKIKSNIRDYEVFFCESPDFLNEFNKYEPHCYVIDETVWNLYGDTLFKDTTDKTRIIIPINEDLKTLSSVQKLYDQLTRYSAKRNLTLISIGGGILQDITGFVASTLYRGINWIFAPTTLLAQADSCIGSKTSLNYGGFKNLIGTFYPPSKIFIYPEFLKTQEDVDFYSGLGEVVKLHIMDGMIKTKELLDVLPNIRRREIPALLNAVNNSLLIKKSYISDDEFDSGRRNLLNFGHCFGHALESTSQFEIPHGQAVVLGILSANIVAMNRGLLSAKTHAFITENLLLPSLAIKPKKEHFDSDAVIEAMKKDKKRTGNELALVMMNDNFENVRVNDLKPSEAERAISESLSYFDKINF